YRIAEYRGVVRGIVVRSRSVLGNIGASVQTFFGGNITLYTDLCERARQDAYALMLRHATEAGANAVVAMRYDANEVAPGVTEVLVGGGDDLEVDADHEHHRRLQHGLDQAHQRWRALDGRRVHARRVDGVPWILAVLLLRDVALGRRLGQLGKRLARGFVAHDD